MPTMTLKIMVLVLLISSCASNPVHSKKAPVQRKDSNAEIQYQIKRSIDGRTEVILTPKNLENNSFEKLRKPISRCLERGLNKTNFEDGTLKMAVSDSSEGIRIELAQDNSNALPEEVLECIRQRLFDSKIYGRKVSWLANKVDVANSWRL